MSRRGLLIKSEEIKDDRKMGYYQAGHDGGKYYFEPGDKRSIASAKKKANRELKQEHIRIY